MSARALNRLVIHAWVSGIHCTTPTAPALESAKTSKSLSRLAMHDSCGVAVATCTHKATAISVSRVHTFHRHPAALFTMVTTRRAFSSLILE